MKAGDHIRILKDGAWHHGIDVGDRTVIHFARPGGVKRSRVEELAAGAAKVEVVTHVERVYAPKMVVARAFSRFWDSAYGAMFDGSEAFAVWCKSGGHPSPQPNGNAEPNGFQGKTEAAGAAAIGIVEQARRVARAVKKVVRAVAGTKRPAAAPPSAKARARRPTKANARPAAKASAKAQTAKAAAGRRAPTKAAPAKVGTAKTRAAPAKAKARAKAKAITRSSAASRGSAGRKGSKRAPGKRAGGRKRR